MKILVITIGTRGDVQPLIALAVGLARAGHAVSVCTSTRYIDAVTSRGLDFRPLSDDLVALVETPEGRRSIDGTGGPLDRLRSYGRLMARSVRIQRDLFRDGWTAASALTPDVIVCHPKMSIGLHYAERLAIPALIAPLFPLFNPTSDYPAPGVPRARLGRRSTAIYNRLSHQALERMIGLASRWLFASWRQSAGLPRLPILAAVRDRADAVPVPLLNGWSQHLLPDPDDGAVENHQTAGFWFLDSDPEWQPSARLVRFLENGDPPVFVGFGSMSGADPKRTTAIVLEALERAGVRGVLSAGWGGLQAEALPDTAMLLGEAPHDWLFERVAAVVHHGGAGTTAAGLRAGRPTVVCPFFGDQPFWAERVHALGVGPGPIPQRRLTAERLAEAIHQALEREDIRQKAAALGQALRQEDGIGKAIMFIEQTVEQAY